MIALAGAALIVLWVPTLSAYRFVVFITWMFAVIGAAEQRGGDSSPHVGRKSSGQIDLSIYRRVEESISQVIASPRNRSRSRLAGHARRLALQMAEVVVPRELFEQILTRIRMLSPAPT